MEFQKIVNDLEDRKLDILVLVITFLFSAVVIVHTVLIITGTDLEPLWMIMGTLAIMLLILVSDKSVMVLFMIIIIGTFVADEEFLLEVAAITSGESLSLIRESRELKELTVDSEKETEMALTVKLKELLESGKDPAEIIDELEEYRAELEIEEDLPGFDPIDKEVIITFANNGPLDESTFVKKMEDKSFTVNDIVDAFENLGAAEYISNVPDKSEMIQLTDKGIELAKTLGVNPVQKTSDELEE